MSAATLSTRLRAACLAAALMLAQLLWAVHEAEALGHEAGEACDLCLALARIDHALVDIVAPAAGEGNAAILHQAAGQPPPGALVREFRARSPPRHRG